MLFVNQVEPLLEGSVSGKGAKRHVIVRVAEAEEFERLLYRYRLLSAGTESREQEVPAGHE